MRDNTCPCWQALVPDTEGDSHFCRCGERLLDEEEEEEEEEELRRSLGEGHQATSCPPFVRQTVLQILVSLSFS